MIFDAIIITAKQTVCYRQWSRGGLPAKDTGNIFDHRESEKVLHISVARVGSDVNMKETGYEKYPVSFCFRVTEWL